MAAARVKFAGVAFVPSAKLQWLHQAATCSIIPAKIYWSLRLGDSSVPSPNCRNLAARSDGNSKTKGHEQSLKCWCGLCLANAYESHAAKLVGICETPH